MQKQLLKAAQEAAQYIDKMQNDLEAAQAFNNLLEERLRFFEEMFGSYEEVQAQALAPCPDAFNFTLEDVAELNAQDAQELTEDQMHAIYQLQLEAEQHASYEDLYKPFKY